MPCFIGDQVLYRDLPVRDRPLVLAISAEELLGFRKAESCPHEPGERMCRRMSGPRRRCVSRAREGQLCGARVSFLASDEASYVSGVELSVDAGVAQI
jgi:hypothetical protein